MGCQCWGVGAGGARESLTRSTQSTKTLSSLTTGDMTAGEREELLSGMRGSPGTLSAARAPSRPCPWKHDRSHCSHPSASPAFHQDSGSSRSPVPHSFLAYRTSTQWNSQCSQQNKGMRAFQINLCRGWDRGRSVIPEDASLLSSFSFGLTDTSSDTILISLK